MNDITILLVLMLVMSSASLIPEALATPVSPTPPYISQGGPHVIPQQILPSGTVELWWCTAIPIDITVVPHVGSGEGTRFTGIFTPSGKFFPVDTAHVPVTIPYGYCHMWNTSTDFPGLTTTEPGLYVWSLQTEWGTTRSANGYGWGFNVLPHFVVPESQVGTVALIGSSLGALGAFVGLKKYRGHLTSYF